MSDDHDRRNIAMNLTEEEADHIELTRKLAKNPVVGVALKRKDWQLILGHLQETWEALN